MGLYEPKSCCICFNTKNGSLILASYSLIEAISCILFAVSGLLTSFLQGFLEPLVQNHALHPQDRDNIILYTCIAVLAVYSLIGVCSCLLIHGIRKDRPGLMLPYLVFQLFCIIIFIITIILGTGSAIYLLNSQMLNFHVLPLIVVTNIVIYFHLVTIAYYKQVKRSLSEDHSILQEELSIDDNGDKIKV